MSRNCVILRDIRPNVRHSCLENIKAGTERFGTFVKFLRIAALALVTTLVGFGFAQDDALDGEMLYLQSCASCHMPEGTGQLQDTPALAGHLPHLYNAEGGRFYLMNVVMFGLSGEVTVLGDTINRSMPPRFTLSNAELAAILNHVLTAWGNADLIEGEFEEFTADELNAVRRQSRDWAMQFRPDIPGDL